MTAQMTQHTKVVPFTIQIADEVLSDLQQRLQRTRWPDEIDGAGWDYGTNLDYLQQLVAYWRDGYDWRAQERLLNHFPQFQATVDGFRLHFLHLKGQGPRPLPLILCHSAQVVVGPRLLVAVVVLDKELQGLLVVLFGLHPLPLILCHSAQLVVDGSPQLTTLLFINVL